MMDKKKVAGYIRVSTQRQVEELVKDKESAVVKRIEKDSLNVQKKSIEDFCNRNNYQLVKIYSDEGISGGSMVERHGLSQCLIDGKEGKFEVLIVHRLSRFGRNARELLENHEQLKAAGIQLRSISEGIDFGTKYGEAMLGMLAIIAQLEKEIIKETMMENRVAKAQRGIPTAGSMPFGRTYDEETEKFKLTNPYLKDVMEKAAQDYLSGVPMIEIARSLGISKSTLIARIRACGDSWTVNYQGTDPIIFKVPRLLSDETIAQINNRLAFKRTNNRSDIKQKYVLAGFVRCEECKGLLTGVTQINYGKPFVYYKHISKTTSNCTSRPHLPAHKIERAVLETIFENFVDIPSFERAIAASLPDDKMRGQLEAKLRREERAYAKVCKDLDKLTKLAIAGTLTENTIKKTEEELLKKKLSHEKNMEEYGSELKGLPDVRLVKKEAETIRRRILDRYSGKQRLEKMTYDEKRELLHFLFDGKDKEGTPYGVYVSKKGNTKDSPIDYFIYGSILQGLRTMKGDNINYMEDEEDGNDDSYNTCLIGSGLPTSPLSGCHSWLHCLRTAKDSSRGCSNAATMRVSGHC